MTFLAGILATVLEWAIEKLISWGVIEAKKEIQTIKDNKKAESDANALANANTDDQKKAALNTTINNTFGD